MAAMAAPVEYRLLTVWRIEAPLDAVYAAVRDSLRWPEWWPGALAVAELAAGDAAGLGSVRRYRWRAALPYRLSFTARTTRVEAPYFVEASIAGDLEGCGSWRFARAGAFTVVRHEWRVRTTRRWMNLCGALARPLFVRNHERIMRRGAEALARQIGGRLWAVESGELAAEGAAGPGFDGGSPGGPERRAEQGAKGARGGRRARAMEGGSESGFGNRPTSRPEFGPEGGLASEALSDAPGRPETVREGREGRERLSSGRGPGNVSFGNSSINSGDGSNGGPRSVPRSLPRLAVVALLAGALAGGIATAAQMFAWWLTDVPVWATLLRDARLTAAIVMGREALQGPSAGGLPWGILFVATLVHLALSAAYALPPARLAGRLRGLPALGAGAAYGLAIYVVNMYGFTVVFPWFALARDPATVFAHLVFGLALAALCPGLSERSR